MTAFRSKLAGRLARVRVGVQAQLFGALGLILAVFLVVVNTYPVIQSRNVVFTSKQSALASQASVMSTTLGGLETLTGDGVGQIIGLLDVDLAYVAVTDAQGEPLYSTGEPRMDSQNADIARALEGKDVFRSRYTGDAFCSSMAMPVRSRGVTLGAVYLLDYDAECGAFVRTLAGHLRLYSLGIGLLAFGTLYLLSRALTARIRELSEAVRVVGEGDYNYSFPPRGRDELTELAADFNTLTQRLRETDQARRRFVADASHELKTPLASIRLLADSVCQSEHMDEATMREFAGDISCEAERLQRLTEKLLSLTRLDSAASVDFHAVDPAVVVNRALTLLRPLAQSSGVRLNAELSGSCRIRATEDGLHQIVFNLVENAIKYNTPGGQARIRLYAAGDRVCLVVEDDGIGIPPEDLPHIFSRFYRVDKARSRATGGAGLGLSIVHDTVQQFGGTVTAEARTPHGTCFTVRFPRLRPEEDVNTEKENLP